MKKKGIMKKMMGGADLNLQRCKKNPKNKKSKKQKIQKTKNPKTKNPNYDHHFKFQFKNYQTKLLENQKIYRSRKIEY